MTYIKTVLNLNFVLDRLIIFLQWKRKSRPNSLPIEFSPEIRLQKRYFILFRLAHHILNVLVELIILVSIYYIIFFVKAFENGCIAALFNIL